MDEKAIKKHILAIGGFKDGKGNVHFIDGPEALMYSLNTKQMKVKEYGLGNGGTAWKRDLEPKDFAAEYPEASKVEVKVDKK